MKRALDVLISIIIAPIVLPIILLLCLLIKIKLGSPVFFLQIRPGLDGKKFKMIKFRTMTNAKNNQGQLLSDADRITKFGSFLRSASLDELPEFLNVICGDMSIVGPRPLLVEYLPLYNDTQARRHEVRPGITGWAQINGRNAISWEEKFKLDVWYVDNCSIWLDIKILFLTMKKVITREGITGEGAATMTSFKGGKNE